MRVVNWIASSAACNPMISGPCRRSAGGGEEIRVWDEAGTFRVIYLARLADAVYVLHAFQKKTQATAKRDIDTAKARLAQLK